MGDAQENRHGSDSEPLGTCLIDLAFLKDVVVGSLIQSKRLMPVNLNMQGVRLNQKLLRITDLLMVPFVFPKDFYTYMISK